jgi:membrane protein required for colicin V production
MNFIDAIIIIILAFAVIRGFTNGLVKEVASLAALILGIWGAIKFSDYTAGKLYDNFNMTGKYVGIISFVVTFGIIAIVIHFIGVLLDKLLEAVALGFVNRLLGMVFGLIKSVLILSVIFVVLNAIDTRRPFLPKERIEKSRLYNPISEIAPAIFPVIGKDGFYHNPDKVKKKPEEVTL